MLNIHRDAPCLIEGQHLGDVRLFSGLSCVDVDEGLAGSVQHLEASRYLLDLPTEPADCVYAAIGLGGGTASKQQRDTDDKL